MDERSSLLSRLDTVNLIDRSKGKARALSVFAWLRAGSRRNDNNTFLTVLLILNYMVGSGILNTPQTFKDSGIAATTVLYLIACELLFIVSGVPGVSPNLNVRSRAIQDCRAGSFRVRHYTAVV